MIKGHVDNILVQFAATNIFTLMAFVFICEIVIIIRTFRRSEAIQEKGWRSNIKTCQSEMPIVKGTLQNSVLLTKQLLAV